MTVTVHGTNGVSLVAPAAVPQGGLQAGVAGNGPCFSAYQSVAQSLAQNTWIKVQLQTKEYDTAAAFDAVTNFRFQPTVAGYYSIKGSVTVTAAVQVVIALYKNGAEAKRLCNLLNTVESTGQADVYLNGSTDYVELWVLQSGVAQNTTAYLAYTYFQGFLARSA